MGFEQSRTWAPEPMGKPGSRSDAKVTVAKRAEMLARVPLFATLSKRQLEKVAHSARGSRWPEQSRVVVEGGLDSFLAIILEGSVEVLKAGKRVAELGTGDFFGEIALLDPGPRTATVRTLTEVVAVDLPRDAFLRTVGTEPKILLPMLQALARRQRSLVDPEPSAPE